MGITQAFDRISGAQYALFGVRTVMLFAGIFLIWRALLRLWELRPLRRKKYVLITEAAVTGVPEEKRSASLDTYFLPRFEYEQDGKKLFYMPKDAVRPCRLRPGDRVTLCLDAKGGFRAVRRSVSPKGSFVMLGVGLLLAILQIVL